MIHILSNLAYAITTSPLRCLLGYRRKDDLSLVVGQHARSPSPPPRLRRVCKLTIIIHQDLAKDDLHYSRGVEPSGTVINVSLHLHGDRQTVTYQAILPVPQTWYVMSASVSLVGFSCMTRSSLSAVLPLKLFTTSGSAKRKPLNCRASG
jgi:hypothetical protein